MFVVNGMFILNSILLGVGLAMDAVAVSMAEGMQEPKMKSERRLLLSGTFGLFQFIMPVLGFALVITVFGFAKSLMKYVSAISTILLLYLSIKMFYSAYLKFRKKETEELQSNLMFQAIGTSVDALSLGFAFSHYSIGKVILASLVIGIVTFFLCYIAIYIGKKFGTIFSGEADLLGGFILLLVIFLF